MLCWELGGEDLKGGASKGAEHGARARGLAAGMGVPEGTVIFFAVDYNAPESDFDAIAAYLRSAQDGIGVKYRAGVYGSYAVAEAMAQRIPGIPVWQCCAWSYGKWSASARVRQYAWQGDSRALAMQAKLGVAVDLDDTETLAGMWMPSVGAGVPGGQMEYDDGEGGVIVEPKPTTPKTPWYAEAMAWAKDKHIINDGRPNDPVTRAELATVLWRMFGPEDSKTDSGLLSE